MGTVPPPGYESWEIDARDGLRFRVTFPDASFIEVQADEARPESKLMRFSKSATKQEIPLRLDWIPLLRPIPWRTVLRWRFRDERERLWWMFRR